MQTAKGIQFAVQPTTPSETTNEPSGPCLGLNPATDPVDDNGYATMSRPLCLLALAGLVASALASDEPLHLNNRIRSISHGGYLFRKVRDDRSQQWVFRVVKDGRVLRTLGDPHPEDYLSMGVVNTLAGGDGLVDLREWDGANHGCWADWLVATEPQFSVVLNTDPYCFAGVQTAHDIDGDGDWELEFETTSFNFFGVGFAYSPMPVAWFKYDHALGRYLPANDLCFAETDKQLQEYRTKLGKQRWEHDGWPAPPHQELRQAVLQVVLAHLYAGHEREGWAFFDRYFPKEMQAEQKPLIQKRLGEDPFLQDLRRTIDARSAGRRRLRTAPPGQRSPTPEAALPPGTARCTPPPAPRASLRAARASR